TARCGGDIDDAVSHEQGGTTADVGDSHVVSSLRTAINPVGCTGRWSRMPTMRGRGRASANGLANPRAETAQGGVGLGQEAGEEVPDVGHAVDDVERDADTGLPRLGGQAGRVVA